FPHRGDRVDGLAVDEAEVARLLRNADLSQTAHHAVESRRGLPFEPRLPRPALANRVHDFVALLPAGDELERNLGRVLEVAVHDRRETAAQLGKRVAFVEYRNDERELRRRHVHRTRIRRGGSAMATSGERAMPLPIPTQPTPEPSFSTRSGSDVQQTERGRAT